MPGKNFSGFVAFIVSTSISGLPSKVVRKSEGIFFINKKSRKKGLKKKVRKKMFEKKFRDKKIQQKIEKQFEKKFRKENGKKRVTTRFKSTEKSNKFQQHVLPMTVLKRWIDSKSRSGTIGTPPQPQNRQDEIGGPWAPFF